MRGQLFDLHPRTANQETTAERATTPSITQPGTAGSVPDAKRSSSARSAPDTLQKSLADFFWSEIPFSKAADLAKHLKHDELAQLELLSVEQLNHWQEEIQHLVKNQCRTAIELRADGPSVGSARQASVEAKLAELLDDCGGVFIMFPPVVTASARPLAARVVYDKLHSALRRACDQLASRFVSWLNDMRDKNLVGTIHWTTKSDCKLDFFRHVVIHESEATVTRTSERVNDDSRSFLRVRETESAHISDKHCLAKHEHHVTQAVAHKLEENWHPVPLQFQPLLDAIPSWLCPHVRILEGHQYLERVFVQNLRQREWQTEPIVRREFEAEPAILIGSYVLAGWGQAELDREKQRLNSIEFEAEKAKIVRAARRWMIASAVLTLPFMVAAVLAIAFSRTAPQMLVPLGGVLTLLAAGAAALSLAGAILSRSLVNDGMFIAAGSLCVVFVTAVLQLLLYWFLYSAWSAIPVAAIAALMTVLAFAIARCRWSNQ
tara:strand:+ start:160 stop:1632 length:1473 start_codon:yes stop_codon:yes gene_type:complete